ncbi:MAG: serine O-acetyltransferase EpsC [Bdellovibrionales bacterium]
MFADSLVRLLFPQIGHLEFKDPGKLEEYLVSMRAHLIEIVECVRKDGHGLLKPNETLADDFFSRIVEVGKQLELDAQFIHEKDPAAESVDEVIICYPGFRALALYRLAHILYQLKIPLVPRILCEYAHERTGIDIHPGAEIGSPFFIDHGTGIVIGETTKIGREVRIFQGVTLGALSVKKNLRGQQRHPTIEDGVIIYANATILGGSTVIGKNSTIGGSVWLTKSVPPGSQIYLNSMPEEGSDS